MDIKLNFLGFNISNGQPLAGPEKASDLIRDCFPLLQQHGITFFDQGNIEQSEYSNQKIFSESALSQIDWNPYHRGYQQVLKLLDQDRFLVNWGGDHSVALSTVGGFCHRYPQGTVLWIDAHADINLPQYSGSGNLHGMPLSILLNLDRIGENHFPWLKSYLAHQQLIYLGIRDVDPFERQVIHQLGIKYYSSHDVKVLGIEAVTQEICQLTASNPLHISFDIDSVSPEYIQSTGLLVPDGLSPEELQTLGRSLARQCDLKSLDVVELNPNLGQDDDPLKTSLVAIQFLKSLLPFNPTHCKTGDLYDDDLRRSHSKYDSAQMESSP